MAESFVNMTEGSGKKAHTFQRVIGANTVEDEAVILGEQYLAQYNVVPPAVALATANSHLLQIMAGSTLNVYIRWIRIFILAVATAPGPDEIDIFRLTTAGTGGTAVTPVPLDGSDAASGATGMTLPTAKGTEAAQPLDRGTVNWIQTAAAAGNGARGGLMLEFNYDGVRDKPLRIAAGTANGIAVKNITARAAGTVIVSARIIEANF